MGTRGIIGFIQKGVYRGAYNHFDSYPSGLGDAIIKFILAHTDEELEEMIYKVEQLKWISASQVQDLDYRVRRYIHFPTIPDYGQVVDAEDLPKDPPSLLIKTFKEQNPSLPPDIDDDEILKRYIPAPFPEKVRDALRGLSWIPEHDETIHKSQHHLLERIWDGQQPYIVDRTDYAGYGSDLDCMYWIDFENKMLEAESIGQGTVHLCFEDMSIGILDDMFYDEYRRNQSPSDLQEAIENVDQLEERVM